MRCRYCGQRIPEGELYCRHCGKEVRIVPDYNPLDDMLTAQIKGAIDGDEDAYEESYKARSSQNRNNRNIIPEENSLKFKKTRFEPQDKELWDEAYKKYLEIVNIKD